MAVDDASPHVALLQSIGVLVVDLAWIADVLSRLVTGRHWIGLRLRQRLKGRNGLTHRRRHKGPALGDPVQLHRQRKAV